MTTTKQQLQTLSTLSQRGQDLAANPARTDIEWWMEAMENLFHPRDNPDGAFPLNVAENSVMADTIQGECQKILQEHLVPDWVLKYTSPAGYPKVREIMAAFMNAHFDSEAIQTDNLVFSAGAAASLEVCSFAGQQY